MKIPEQIIEQINNRVSIIDIAGAYVKLEKNGTRYRACCPFHQEKTPSFYLTPEKNLYYCFGCQKGGTVFNFLMDIENVPFPEAIEILAEKAGIDLSDYKNIKPGLSDGLKELNNKIAAAFHFVLNEKKESAHVKAYLQKRGFSQEISDLFSLGYSPDDRYWLHRFLKKKNYSNDFLEKSGLFSKRYPEISLFSGRLIFPIHSARGDIIAFGGRALGDANPKYMNSPETDIYKKRENLYGFYAAKKYIKETGHFFIVEGYMDVLAMFQAGLKNTVAPLGTAFTENQARILKRYADKAILLFDGDKAGKNATKKSISTCEKAELVSEVIEFGTSSDPADILEKEGAEALQKKVKYPINSFKYLVKNAQIDINISSPEGKLSFLTELFPYIESISTETKRELYLRELSGIINVDYISVLRDYEGYQKGGIRKFPAAKQAEKKSSYKPRMSFDLILMLSVAVNFEYFAKVRNSIFLDDLEDEKSRELFIIFEDCFRNEVFTIDSLLNCIEEPGLKTLILEKIASDEFKNNQEEVIIDTVKQIKIRSLKNKKKEIEKLLSSKDFSVNSEKELQEESIFLDGELLKLKVRNNG